MTTTTSEIMYSAIAFDNSIILVDYSIYEGNDLLKTTVEILNGGINPNERASVKYDTSCVFYYINVNVEKLTIVAACTVDYPQQSAFFFLEETIELFEKTVRPEDYADPSPNCVEDKFRNILKGKMEHFNQNPKKDSVDTLTEQLIGFKNIVIEANDNLFQRGKQIDIIVDKAAHLKEEVKFYQVSSKKVNKSEICKKVGMTLCLIFVVCLLIYGGLAIGCGYDLSECIKFN